MIGCFERNGNVVRILVPQQRRLPLISLEFFLSWAVSSFLVHICWQRAALDAILLGLLITAVWEIPLYVQRFRKITFLFSDGTLTVSKPRLLTTKRQRFSVAAIKGFTCSKSRLAFLGAELRVTDGSKHIDVLAGYRPETLLNVIGELAAYLRPI